MRVRAILLGGLLTVLAALGLLLSSAVIPSQSAQSSNLKLTSFTETIKTDKQTQDNDIVIPQGVTVTASPGMLRLPGSLTVYGVLRLSGSRQSGVSGVSAKSIQVGKNGVIESSSTINLSTVSGKIANSGEVRSDSGSINLTSEFSGTAIDVTASGGKFEAPNQSISVRNSAYRGSGAITLSGGQYQSRTLNLYAGSGTAATSVESITGLVNIEAGQEHTLVSAGNLRLGAVQVSGDPTFFNSNGNVTIGGNISVGQALSIVASGNILSSGNFAITANGSQINLIAGADISAPGSSSSLTVGPYTSGGTGTPAVAPISISGPSSTGGSVTFSGYKMKISSAAATANGSGGDIDIIAFASSSGAGGQVSMAANSSIISGGSGTGANGDVQILAGAPTGAAIATGSIDSSGGTGGAGDVNIESTQPAPTPNPVVISTSGSVVAGGFNSSTADPNPASVTIAASITSGGKFTVGSAQSITIPAGVTVASSGPVLVNMNTSGLAPTFTLNGVISTTASNTSFPDPLGGVFYYSVLIQNLVTNFNVAGTGTIVQAGATPGNTVFNDFLDVGFNTGTQLHIKSSYPGSYTNFFTRQIQLNGNSGAATASLTVQSNAVNFNTNLPSFGPGDVAFVGGPATTTANFQISGAPVNIGFIGSPPPVSIPAEQEPVGNLSVGANFSLASASTITADTTNSVSIAGNMSSSAGAVDISSPTTRVASGSQLESAKLLQIAGENLGSAVTVVNNGLIRANGSGSIVGVNGGSSGAINVSGAGTIVGAQANFGNLDPSTLVIQPPYVTVNFSGSYTLGNISVTQASITGVMHVSS